MASFLIKDIKPGDGWEDLVIPLTTAKIPTTSAPTWTAFQPGGSGNLYAYAFAKGDQAFVTFHIPHDMKTTSKLYFHVHFCTSGTSTEEVGWDIEYSCAKGHNQEAFSTSTTLSISQAASSTAYLHQIVELSDVQAPTTKETDSLYHVRLSRNTTGNNLDTVFGLMIDIHYESTNRHTNEKTYPFTSS